MRMIIVLKKAAQGLPLNKLVLITYSPCHRILSTINATMSMPEMLSVVRRPILSMSHRQVRPILKKNTPIGTLLRLIGKGFSCVHSQ